MIRAIDKWLAGYLASMARRARKVSAPGHLIFCVADHFEPFRGGVTTDEARARVQRWVREYPSLAAGHRDADGISPKHTFFYPAEEYDPSVMDLLTELVATGHGEVDVHLHHRNDTPAGLTHTLETFVRQLADGHGLLGREADGRPAYGFIHGNWALCNSRPDGDWCGVNEELTILRDTGCYADFTFPSAPSPTQPRMVNALYYARDRAGKPRGCDRGTRVRVGSTAPDGGMLIVQGPLAPDWHRRKWGLLPRLENAELSGVNPPTPARAALWARQHIHVAGQPDWVFVKVHTHGCVPGNTDILLGEPMQQLYTFLSNPPGAEWPWRSHFTTARELANIVRAAADGRSGNPGDYRDYAVSPPPAAPHPSP